MPYLSWTRSPPSGSASGMSPSAIAPASHAKIAGPTIKERQVVTSVAGSAPASAVLINSVTVQVMQEWRKACFFRSLAALSCTAQARNALKPAIEVNVSQSVERPAGAPGEKAAVTQMSQGAPVPALPAAGYAARTRTSELCSVQHHRHGEDERRRSAGVAGRRAGADRRSSCALDRRPSALELIGLRADLST